MDINPEMGNFIIIESNGIKFTAMDIAKAGVESFLAATASVPNMPMILSVNGNDRSSICSLLGYPLSNFEEKLKLLSVQTESLEFSYALSLNFSLYNKYRLKNGIDRFGYGFTPHLIDPFNVILITNKEGLQNNQNLNFQKSSKESQNRANLSELINEPYRWDQHIYLVVIADDMDEEASNLIQTGELSNLARATGGDVFRCNSFKSAQVIFRELASKVFFNHPSLVVKLTSDLSPETNPLFVHMMVKGSSEWVIPDSEWVDFGTEQLHSRTAQPVITISSKYAIANGNYSDENPSKYLQMAKLMEFPIDVYELNMSKVQSIPGLEKYTQKQSISSYLSKRCGYAIEKLYLYASVSKSGRMEVSVNAAGQSVLNSASHPFAILGPGKSAGSWELSILPYNFPKLFPILKHALDQSSTQQLSLMNQLRLELTQYLKTIPPYCHNHILQVLSRLYAPLRPAFQIAVEDKLHRTPFRRIQKATEIAAADLKHIEHIAQESWPEPSKDINTLALESATDIVKSVNIPTSVHEIKSDQLLGTWEKMRRILYGGSGFTVQGLSVSGIRSSCNVHRDVRSITSGQLFTAIGANYINEKSIKDMSDYRPILAVREALRDPMNLTPDADEDTADGLLKRKFDVNFGNRFKKSKRSRGGVKGGVASEDSSINSVEGMEIEGISGLLTSSSASIKRDRDTDSDEKSVIMDPIAKADIFFMDTPNPYSSSTPSSSANSVQESCKGEEDVIDASYDSTDMEYSETSSISSVDQSIEAFCSKAAELSSAPSISLSQSSGVTAIDSDSSVASKSLSPHVTDTTNSSSTTSSSSVPVANERPLPPGWTRCFSKRQQREYWFHSGTGESVWEFPSS
jgi:hypothetical protein